MRPPVGDESWCGSRTARSEGGGLHRASVARRPARQELRGGPWSAGQLAPDPASPVRVLSTRTAATIAEGFYYAERTAYGPGAGRGCTKRPPRTTDAGGCMVGRNVSTTTMRGRRTRRRSRPCAAASSSSPASAPAGRVGRAPAAGARGCRPAPRRQQEPEGERGLVPARAAPAQREPVAERAGVQLDEDASEVVRGRAAEGEDGQRPGRVAERPDGRGADPVVAREERRGGAEPVQRPVHDRGSAASEPAEPDGQPVGGVVRGPDGEVTDSSAIAPVARVARPSRRARRRARRASRRRGREGRVGVPAGGAPVRRSCTQIADQPAYPLPRPARRAASAASRPRSRRTPPS